MLTETSGVAVLKAVRYRLSRILAFMFDRIPRTIMAKRYDFARNIAVGPSMCVIARILSFR